MSRKRNGRSQVFVEPMVESADAVPEVEVVEPVVHITVPVAPLEEGAYVGDHIDVHLDHLQRVVMRRMLNGLKANGAQLDNGRAVQNYGDVIRYILEQAHNADRT